MDEHVFADDGDGDCRHCPLPKAHPIHAEPALPELPYAGTSGWSGSETSHERAVSEDESGTTTERQGRVLAILAAAGRVGATWREVADSTGWHHGQASGALSVLHKRDRVARLAERRNKCQVYVLPEYVDGRETKPHGRAVLTPEETAALDEVHEAIEDGAPLPRGLVVVLVNALHRIAKP